MPNGLRAWQGLKPGGSCSVRRKRKILNQARHRPQKSRRDARAG
ncbi:hypothetical protein [Leisingera caerulea]|nr:hypothetical protein [Leisingera caerulea]